MTDIQLVNKLLTLLTQATALEVCTNAQMEYVDELLDVCTFSGLDGLAVEDFRANLLEFLEALAPSVLKSHELCLTKGAWHDERYKAFSTVWVQTPIKGTRTEELPFSTPLISKYAVLAPYSEDEDRYVGRPCPSFEEAREVWGNMPPDEPDAHVYKLVEVDMTQD